jgi:hypothetical protein
VADRSARILLVDDAGRCGHDRAAAGTLG